MGNIYIFFQNRSKVKREISMSSLLSGLYVSMQTIHMSDVKYRNVISYWTGRAKIYDPYQYRTNRIAQYIRITIF